MRNVEKIAFVALVIIVIGLFAYAVPPFLAVLMEIGVTIYVGLAYVITYAWWTSAIFFTSVTTFLFVLGIKGYFKVLRFGNAQARKNIGFVPMAQPTYQPMVIPQAVAAPQPVAVPALPDQKQ